MPTDDFERADRLFDRAIEAAPNSVGARLGKAMLAADLKGDLSEIDTQLAQMEPRTLVGRRGYCSCQAYLLMLQRKFERRRGSSKTVA